MSKLEGPRAPEPFRTREDEPEPLRAFTGWTNGRTDWRLYRAHLIRLRWDVEWADWVYPDTCWGVSLCGYDAYPRRWRSREDWILNPDCESYVADVAQMELCMTCAKVYRERTGKEFEG